MSTASKNPGPDVSQLRETKLPEAPFPAGRNQAYRVYLAPEVHSGIWQHAVENSTVEICGVLVGRWARDGNGPHAQATAYIRGEAASSKFAEVTFTHETWAKINQQMDTRYADQSVIGWYHSHPDFGIFLSDRDRFIQEHFFAGAGQFAYVVDPIRKTEGIFIWKEGKPTLAPYHWIGERVQIATPAGEPSPKDAEPASKGPAPASSAGAGPTRSAEWVDGLMRLASYACIFLLGLLLAGFVTHSLNDFERLRIEQAARTQALLYVNYRPGLGEELDEVRNDLNGMAVGLAALVKQQPELIEKSPESRQQWTEIAKRLARALDRTAVARATYALPPDENARLLKLLSGGKAEEPKNEKDREASKGLGKSGSEPKDKGS
jgi:proteasome lid subunit RPN8/RPN11